MYKGQLRPPYEVSGRVFFKEDQTLSIFIRCCGLEIMPDDNGQVNFGVNCTLTNQFGGEMRMRAWRMKWKKWNHKTEESKKIGKSDAYNFRIVDRGVLHSIEFFVERSGKDGNGDHNTKYISLHVPYLKEDPLHWFHYIVVTTDLRAAPLLLDRLMARPLPNIQSTDQAVDPDDLYQPFDITDIL